MQFASLQSAVVINLFFGEWEGGLVEVISELLRAALEKCRIPNYDMATGRSSPASSRSRVRIPTTSRTPQAVSACKESNVVLSRRRSEWAESV